jgi:hypothetical protein
MSQAESAYTTSPSIVRDSPAVRRRQVIEGGAALLAAAVTGTRTGACAIPVAPDPIHAAIEAHVRAFSDLRTLFAELDATDRALRTATKSMRRELATRLAKLCTAEESLGRAEMEAAEHMSETVPGTLAGAAAALRYVREHFDDGEYALYEDDGYRTLLFSTECTICSAVGLPIPVRRQ